MPPLRAAKTGPAREDRVKKRTRMANRLHPLGATLKIGGVSQAGEDT